MFYFAQAIRNYVPKELWHYIHDNKSHQTIDMSVYASGKEFRMIWNTKMDKNRFLDIDPRTGLEARFPRDYDDPIIISEELQQVRLFAACMVTYYQGGTLLPDWAPVESNKPVKEVITINDQQKDNMIQIFNASEYSDVWKISENQSCTSNSVYLVMITKPCYCPIHHRNHDSNNAKLSMSASGNIYITCYADSHGRDSFLIIGKDTTITIDSEYDSDYEDDGDDNAFEEPIYNIFGCYNFRTSSIIEPNNNKQHTQRVPAHPIINGDVSHLTSSSTDHGTLTSGTPRPLSMTAIENNINKNNNNIIINNQKSSNNDGYFINNDLIVNAPGVPKNKLEQN